MAPHNRPRSRQTNVTGGSGKSVRRRGGGLGTGPVGSQSGYSGRRRPGGSTGSYHSGSSPAGRRSGQRPVRRRFGQVPVSGYSGPAPVRRYSGKSRLVIIAVLIILYLLYNGIRMLTQNPDADSDSYAGASENSNYSGDITNIGGGYPLAGTEDNGTMHQDGTDTAGTLNTTTAAGSREKYTSIIGGGADQVTVMVYLCGTDLESKNGMATADLKEMAAATLSDQVNLIIYTGGCKSWRNTAVSSEVNQIWQVTGGGLKCLEEDMGSLPMTEPDTLTGFINWCAEHFPANRNELILWDHGGGSVSGYGYDEKFRSNSSMTLADLDHALDGAGMKFDFIGFDACLMATLENGLMLSRYCDYMIASEETEPGVGWYYTDWLTALSADTSMPTVEIGRTIIDDFVDVCARNCKGQKTTLSIVDLAELENTVPEKFTAFAASTNQLIQDQEYQTVSDARYRTREFAQSSAIDQVDLVHLAQNMGTAEGRELANALLGCVKYNRTASNISNAYGLSIYFPYRKTSYVDNAVATYTAIGLDEEYSRCIKSFARLEVSGQIATGGTGTAASTLFGSGYDHSSLTTAEAVTDLLSLFLRSQGSDAASDDRIRIAGLNENNSSFLIPPQAGTKEMDTEAVGSYIAAHSFDPGRLVWTLEDNQHKIILPEEQWDLVHDLELNLFYDDGEGYIDLGMDNVFAFDENGQLIGETDGTWLAINDQPVAYYYLDTFESDTEDYYSITGRVPALLNGERVNLILVFDTDSPYGYIAGATTDYVNRETETVAKSLITLNTGDTLDFLCDYYAYDGTYQDSYYLGEQMTVTDTMTISNVPVNGPVSITYRFTDIYNQSYWTPVLE